MNNKLSAKPHYFERGLLKSNAKLVLNLDYAPVLFGVLLSWLIPYVIMFQLFLISDISASLSLELTHMGADTGNSPLISDIVVWVLSGINSLVALFIVPAFQVGRSSFLLKARRHDAKVKYIFDSFRKGRFFKVSRKMLAVDLVTHGLPLLTLLGVVILNIVIGTANEALLYSIMPVFAIAYLAIFAWLIFLHYKYLFASFILAENPDISVRKLFSTCREMTNGYKYDLLVLDLSFFLWHLLGRFLGGIAEIFITPYVQTTFAEAYCLIKSNYLLSTADDPEAGATAYIRACGAPQYASSVAPPENAAPVAMASAPVLQRPLYKKPIAPTEEYVNEYDEEDPLPILMVDDEEAAVDTAASLGAADNDE